MTNLIEPFQAILYSEKNRKKISDLVVADLDSAHSLWGDIDSTFSFRNVLVGPVQQRGEIWQAWLGAREVELMDEPAYFIVHHQCRVNEKNVNRWSLIASVDITKQSILIHEDIFPDGVERARQSMEACEGDLAPVFMGCAQQTGLNLRTLLRELSSVCEKIMQYQEKNFAEYTVWICKEVELQKKISTLFEQERLFLLDGHHRLAAAQENFRQGLGDGKLMAAICSMEADDTVILPIHRTIYYDRWMLPDNYLADLSSIGCKYREIQDWRPEKIPELLESLKTKVGICLSLHAHTNSLLELQLPMQKSLPTPLQPLAIAHLEALFMQKMPKLALIPIPDEKHIFDYLAMDQAQVGFFLPPLEAKQVRDVALAGIKLPKKSTRFMPKPALGLVSRPWLK